jgi:FMN phosphatase YigB (HAD superfamily)
MNWLWWPAGSMTEAVSSECSTVAPGSTGRRRTCRPSSSARHHGVVPIQAVLVDVGGTLWPDQWTPHPDDRRDQVDRVRALDPALDEGAAAELVDAIGHLEPPEPDGGAQDTNAAIAAVLEKRDIRLDPFALRRAVSLPFAGRHQMLKGAAAMVRALKADGLQLTVISNTLLRDADCYWSDFAAAGLDACLSGIITSVDVGWRKPHRAMFDAALAVTGVPASRTAIVGNSETSDILPALDLGLIAVLVAIEQPPPIFSSADAVVTSLEDVPAILRVS